VLQQSICALEDSFAAISVPVCSLHAHARRATSGDVKKYQQAFLAPLPGNGCREFTNPTILVSFVFPFLFYLYPVIHGRLSLYTPSARQEWIWRTVLSRTHSILILHDSPISHEASSENFFLWDKSWEPLWPCERLWEPGWHKVLLRGTCSRSLSMGRRESSTAILILITPTRKIWGKLSISDSSHHGVSFP
jgi:hypothetical protein